MRLAVVFLCHVNLPEPLAEIKLAEEECLACSCKNLLGVGHGLGIEVCDIVHLMEVHTESGGSILLLDQDDRSVEG